MVGVVYDIRFIDVVDVVVGNVFELGDGWDVVGGSFCVVVVEGEGFDFREKDGIFFGVSG